MINAIAIDDEANALGIIKEYTRNIPDLNLLETFTDPMLAEAWLHKNPETRLVFLDIQMARMNGIELLRRNRNSKAKVIITTAYPDYALQGFDLNVSDYLIKPFSMERFRQAMEKIRDSQVYVSTKSSIQHPCTNEIIFVRTEYRIMKVTVSDIHYLEGTGNYVSIHLPGGRVLSLQNMRSLEQMLKNCGLFRIHRSYIVSIRHIDTVTRKSVTIAGKELPIGDSYREPFFEHIGKHYMFI